MIQRRMKVMIRILCSFICVVGAMPFAVPSAYAGSGSENVRPVAMFSKTDLALGKPVVVSSTASAGMGGSILTDGNLNGFWSSEALSGPACNEWAYINLGAPKAFNQVVLYPREVDGHTYGFPTAFQIQGSNDASSWTTLAAQSEYPTPAPNGAGVAFSVGSRKYQYVRLLATRAGKDNLGDYYVQMGQIGVYNNPAIHGNTVTVPRLTSVGSTSGTEGTAVTIAGSNFGSVQGRSTVDFGTTAATVTSWSNTSIKARVPNIASGATTVAVIVSGLASNAVSFTVTAPPAAKPWNAESSTWVGTDSLGRSLPTSRQVGLPRPHRYVGMFYSIWHQDIVTNGIYNNTQILTKNPGALSNPNSPPWPPYGTNDYWGKPLFGYYQDQDPWVLTKQAQMLANAGVDTIIIDLSNFSPANLHGTYYKSSWLKLFQVWQDIRQHGGKTPQVMFLCPFGYGSGAPAVNQLYKDLYAKGLYADLWFRWQGKPLILSSPAQISNPAEQHFFTFRDPQPGYQGGSVNQWGWLSDYPQPRYGTASNPNEEMTVGIAQNAFVTGGGLTSMSNWDSTGFMARGRSYHNGAEYQSHNPLSPKYHSQMGYNFAEQWTRALQDNPNFVFVTGWNEWVAGRASSWANDPGPNVFPDEFVPEFSRDIEPMSGGWEDDYYNQLVQFVRRFKGVAPLPTAGAPVTLPMNGHFRAWANVKPTYRNNVAVNLTRDWPSVSNATTYVNHTARNVFKQMKVARDSRYVYFYAQTDQAITPHTDPNWMLLFIRTNTSQPNWQDFNYVVNLSVPSSTTTTLQKSVGGWKWKMVDNHIRYRVSGNQIELAIPRSDLGFGNTAQPVQFDFKWADNIQSNSDGSQFYLNGNVAPNDRFAYRFETAPPVYSNPSVFAAAAYGNTLTGVASYLDYVAGSRFSMVGYVGHGASLQFNHITVHSTGAYPVTIHYVNPDPHARTALMSVDGGKPVQMTFPGTGGRVGQLHLPVSLHAQVNNTIRFSNPNGWAPDFDNLVIPGAR